MKQQKSNPITLVLLGDIAAGKGTQAKLLVESFKLKYIGTGVFSRKLLSGEIETEVDVSRVAEGKLTPTDLIKNYLRTELQQLRPDEGVLVEGGKMPDEAKLIHQIFQKQQRKALVIYLSIPQKEIFARLQERYEAEKRDDDRLEAVKNRIAYYEKVYTKTVEFWQKQGLLQKVSGLGSVREVNQRLNKVIEEYFAKK